MKLAKSSVIAIAPLWDKKREKANSLCVIQRLRNMTAKFYARKLKQSVFLTKERRTTESGKLYPNAKYKDNHFERKETGRIKSGKQ
ncbi:hypothetical protein [Nostoc sp.]|uniref:hypothetical protein n=1 Tax=Nostoc sp. TaxID=1180 RepID=UPI002FF4EAEF